MPTLPFTKMHGAGNDYVYLDLFSNPAPADPVQFLLRSKAHRLGTLAFTRWAATVADHPRFGWKEWLKGFVYRGWDGYLVTGKRGLEYLLSFGVPVDRTVICGNPVDAAPIVRARVSTSTGRRPGFLFVGRFLVLKNLEAFVPAFARYVREGGRWGLKIAGSGDPDTVQRLRAAAADTPEIEFLGHLQFDELISLYVSEGALVLPSYSENWGLVVNEAMHAGMPIVISETCGCAPELLDEGGNGFALDPHDEDSMLRALFSMERLGQQERHAMSERSLEIIDDHDVDSWAHAVADAITRSTRRTNRPRGGPDRS